MVRQKRVLIGIVAVLVASAAVAGGALDFAWLKGVTDKNPLFYEAGEEMVFTLTLEDLEGAVPEGAFRLKWKRTGDDGVTEEGVEPVNGAPFVYRTRLGKPGFVRLYAEVVDAKTGRTFTKKFTGDATTPDGRRAMNRFEKRPRTLFFDGGAGVGIDTLQARPEPDDFDAFWERQRARLAKIPMKAERIKVGETTNVTIYAVQVDCAGTRPMTGYLTVPRGAEAGAAKFPCQLFMHGYVYRAPHVAPADGPANRIRLDINAHGMRLPAFGADAAYYKRFGAEIRTKGPGQDTYAFNTEENADPEVAYFNGMVLRIMRALQYLKSLPEWNGADLWAEGASQGGLQTIWAAACGEGVTKAEATIPWCCDLGGELIGRNRGTWFIPWADGLGYYDPVNFAKRIPKSCRTEICRAGLGDYICPPSGVAILWNNIPGNKKIRWVQGSTHGYVAPVDYPGRDIVRED